ncbi:MAG: class I SAM-dependent methyltransferase [Ignavibacteria bacterium]
MDIEKIALNIRKDENGIYYSKSDSAISYPEEGNENCMQIEKDSFWFSHRNNVISESIKKHSPDKVFFDIGGGNGFVSKRLQDDGLKVLLVEPGKTGAMNAYQRGIKNVICSTLEDTAFIPNSIDSAGLFDVVEHIEDDYSFLKNINKYIKDDGYIYITVPAYNFLWSKEDYDAGHFKRYTISDLKKLLKGCGFSIIYSTYIFSILPLPVFLFRSLPGKLGLNTESRNLEKHQSEHTVKNGFTNNLMNRIWEWELNRIKKNKKIPLGGSCFVIGKKVTGNKNHIEEQDL